MKTFLFTLPLCITLATAQAWADDARRPDEQKKATAPEAKSAPPKDITTNKEANKPVEDNMKKMRLVGGVCG